jgi:hypothetical protein
MGSSQPDEFENWEEARVWVRELSEKGFDSRISGPGCSIESEWEEAHKASY